VGAAAKAAEFTMPRPQLKDARRIVSVGRQVGDVEAARRLAAALGAEFAGAREALDEGYIDESQVVGVTGARVAPDVYIALGIRGDTQHAFGIQDARFVVAVHPDPDAPIFKQADVGIVGDPSAVAEELRKKVSWL
jgi:electron transfer flavoprotein alpha subunit